MLSLHGSDGACSSVAIKVLGVNYGFRIADFEESGVFYHGLLIRRILSLRILTILFRCVHYVVAFGHTHIYIYICMLYVCMYVRTFFLLAQGPQVGPVCTYQERFGVLRLGLSTTDAQSALCLATVDTRRYG